jgi:hypothetical protein
MMSTFTAEDRLALRALLEQAAAVQKSIFAPTQEGNVREVARRLADGAPVVSAANALANSPHGVETVLEALDCCQASVRDEGRRALLLIGRKFGSKWPILPAINSWRARDAALEEA